MNRSERYVKGAHIHQSLNQIAQIVVSYPTCLIELPAIDNR